MLPLCNHGLLGLRQPFLKHAFRSITAHSCEADRWYPIRLREDDGLVLVRHNNLAGWTEENLDTETLTDPKLSSISDLFEEMPLVRQPRLAPSTPDGRPVTQWLPLTPQWLLRRLRSMRSPTADPEDRRPDYTLARFPPLPRHLFDLDVLAHRIIGDFDLDQLMNYFHCRMLVAYVLPPLAPLLKQIAQRAQELSQTEHRPKHSIHARKALLAEFFEFINDTEGSPIPKGQSMSSLFQSLDPLAKYRPSRLHLSQQQDSAETSHQ